MYFDQPTGAPHAVLWSKSFVFALKQVFSYFSVTNRKKERKKKGNPHKNMQIHAIKGWSSSVLVTL